MLRNLIKILFDLIKWFGGLFLLFVSLICLSIFIYIEFGGNWLITEDEKLKLIEEVNSAEPLPDLFYEVNQKYFPEGNGKKFWYCSIKTLFNKKNYYSESLKLSRLFHINLYKNEIRNSVYKRFYPYTVTRLIEKNISLKQCYNYRIRNSEYSDNTKNVIEAANWLFNKSLDELNEEEKLGLHVIYIAPTTYNPRRNPDNYQEKIASIIKEYN